MVAVLALDPHPNIPRHGAPVVARPTLLQRLRLRDPRHSRDDPLALGLGRRRLLRQLRQGQRQGLRVQRVR